MTSYMERRVAKDFIQLEIVVEKEGQKGILLGKVRSSQYDGGENAEDCSTTFIVCILRLVSFQEFWCCGIGVRFS